MLLYRTSVFLYSCAVRTAALFNPKAKLFIEGRKGLLLQIKAALGNERRPRIWMHCASLGEFEQGRPILEYLRRQYPGYALVLTFFSPSGYQVRKKYDGVDYVFYLPLDGKANARQFVQDINPELAIFVKYDLWYYYLAALQQRQIPAILISAIFRPGQGYFKWYGTAQRKMLQLLSHIFVQDQASAALLQQIGINQVTIAGDTRFDRVSQAAASAPVIPALEPLAGTHQLVIAGSTWPEDERLWQEAVAVLPDNWKLVLVPHEVHESHISDIEQLFSGNTRRWSEWQSGPLTQKVLIVDTIGLLLKIYRYGSIAWIGGGLSSSGVHNVLEAAVYGMPCAYGPVHEKYAEAVSLIAAGGATVCSNPAALKAQLTTWINDDTIREKAALSASSYVQQHTGATQVIADYLAAKNWLSTL